MKRKIDGIIPVMLTPFDDNGAIDWDGLGALIHWYLAKGAEGLFAVCQSSEMQCLSLAERTDIAEFTVKTVSGRVPVIASGHIADTPPDQAAELLAMAKTGIDGLVLVSNRLVGNVDGKNDRFHSFRAALGAVTASLPRDLPLGLYECPAPFRRLLTDDEIKFLADDPRFVMIKDVSCDLDIVTRRLGLVKGSGLAINNANAAIAHDAFKAGANGFCGVFNNFHPDLYRWLRDEGPSNADLADALAVYLALAASTEYMGYPKLAKLYHQRLGTIESAFSRAVPENIVEKFWALDAVLEKIEMGGAHYRSKISDLRKHP
jgi:4-hydroxy-tetrahydrodipicolinate synthase